MTTPSSPPISMENVRAELSTSYPISLNQSNVLQLAGKSAAPISLLDLLGKSNVTSNAMFVAQFQVGSDPDGNPLNAFGFSDGGGFDGPPGSGSQFGSLQDGNISGYTTNALYTYEPEGTTYFITRGSYGAGFFSGWQIGVWTGASFITAYTLSYLYSVDATQSYTTSGGGWVQAYAGTSQQIALKPP